MLPVHELPQILHWNVSTDSLLFIDTPNDKYESDDNKEEDYTCDGGNNPQTNLEVSSEPIEEESQIDKPLWQGA